MLQTLDDTTAEHIILARDAYSIRRRPSALHCCHCEVRPGTDGVEISANGHGRKSVSTVPDYSKRIYEQRREPVTKIWDRTPKSV